MTLNFFKSKKFKAYKQGFKAGSANAHELDNPYKDEAIYDNIKRGMGLSPSWDTEYKPFIEWHQGWSDARQSR